MIPDENGEYLERPVVEQFRTYWDAKKKILITEPVEIAAQNEKNEEESQIIKESPKAMTRFLLYLISPIYTL